MSTQPTQLVIETTPLDELEKIIEAIEEQLEGYLSQIIEAPADETIQCHRVLSWLQELLVDVREAERITTGLKKRYFLISVPSIYYNPLNWDDGMTFNFSLSAEADRDEEE